MAQAGPQMGGVAASNWQLPAAVAAGWFIGAIFRQSNELRKKHAHEGLIADQVPVVASITSTSDIRNANDYTTAAEFATSSADNITAEDRDDHRMENRKTFQTLMKAARHTSLLGFWLIVLSTVALLSTAWDFISDTTSIRWNGIGSGAEKLREAEDATKLLQQTVEHQREEIRLAKLKHEALQQAIAAEIAEVLLQTRKNKAENDRESAHSKAERTALRSEIDDLARQLEGMKKDASAAQGLISDLQGDTKKKTLGDLDGWEQDVREGHKQALESLESRLARKTELLCETRDDLHREKISGDEAQEKIHGLQLEGDEAARKISNCKTEIDALNDEVFLQATRTDAAEDRAAVAETRAAALAVEASHTMGLVYRLQDLLKQRGHQTREAAHEESDHAQGNDDAAGQGQPADAFEQEAGQQEYPDADQDDVQTTSRDEDRNEGHGGARQTPCDHEDHEGAQPSEEGYQGQHDEDDTEYADTFDGGYPGQHADEDTGHAETSEEGHQEQKLPNGEEDAEASEDEYQTAIAEAEATLGLTPGEWDKRAIGKAKRTLSLANHPDKQNPEDKEAATTATAKINNAADLLEKQWDAWVEAGLAE